MKPLPDPSLEAALTGTPFGPRYTEPLALERRITAVHRQHERSPSVVRELAVLRVQFPDCLQPVAEEDVFAGRILYPLVNFSPGPGGLGYACREDAVRTVLAERTLDEAARTESLQMLEYWRTRATAARARAAWPGLLRRALPPAADAAATPRFALGGSVLDFGRLVRLGLPGLWAEAERRRETASSDQAAFLDGVVGALDLFAGSCAFYAAQARRLADDRPEGPRRAELLRIALSLEALLRRAPATLHEGIQLVWLYALHAGARNYGRVDAYLGPLLARDLGAGRLDEAGAFRLIQGWWRLIEACPHAENNRLCVGGTGRPDDAAADQFAVLALEASRTLGLTAPQLCLRLHPHQSPALLERALTSLGEGTTVPVLLNDAVNVPALARLHGLPADATAHYAPTTAGCLVPGSGTLTVPAADLHLPRCLDLALRGGPAPDDAPDTAAPAGDGAVFRTFDQLETAFTAQVARHAAACADHAKILLDAAGADAPFLFQSALTGDCLERGRPLLGGGLRHEGAAIIVNGLANAADALHAINEVVFRRRTVPLAAVMAAIDRDFAGPDDEQLHLQLRSVPKYGNGDAGADAAAARVLAQIDGAFREQTARSGLAHLKPLLGPPPPDAARLARASADGARAGDPVATGAAPVPGMDRAGGAAALAAAAGLDPELHVGALVPLTFARESFARARPRLAALFDEYWKRGGPQLEVTVLAAADLEIAWREPARWRHLLVRLGGGTVRFGDLPRPVQELVFRQTCHQ